MHICEAKHFIKRSMLGLKWQKADIIFSIKAEFQYTLLNIIICYWIITDFQIIVEFCVSFSILYKKINC